MINGTYNILYIDFGVGGFFPIGLLTSNSFSEEIDFLDTTTQDNAGWKTQVLTNQSYNIDFSGLVINSISSFGDPTKIGYDRLQNIKRNRILIDWKIINGRNGMTETGKGQITALSNESNIDEFISFSATLKGYGTITQTEDLSGILDLPIETII